MLVYPYHNKIRNRIKKGELTGYSFVNDYNGIKPCLLLYFSTFPHVRPIRSYRFIEYLPILEQFDMEEKIKKLKALYMDSFKDSETFTNAMFDFVYNLENCKAISLDNGDILSMAFFIKRKFSFFSKTLNGVFLSGVATAESYRGKGLMYKLLQSGLEECHDNGVDIVTLSPANEKYYLSLGFRSVVRGEKVKIDSVGNDCIKAEEIFKDEFLSLYTKNVSCTEISAMRSLEDVDRMMKVYNVGDAKVYKVSGEGYFVVDGEEIYEYSVGYDKLTKIRELDGKYLVKYGEGESRYMARILNPKSVLQCMCIKKEIKPVVLTVIDTLLDKRTNLLISSCNGVIKVKSVEKTGREISIEDLTEWCFGVQNEIVEDVLGIRLFPKIVLCDRYL